MADLPSALSVMSSARAEPEFMFKMFLEVMMTVTHALAELYSE